MTQMFMDPEILAKLKSYCRDDDAFQQLSGVLEQEYAALGQQVAQARFQVDQQKTLFALINRLRDSLDLETIFQATAIEVREFLSADRVAMFRFLPDTDWNDGEFVSEDVDPAFVSALTHKVHDHCFGEQFAPQYHQGRSQVVTDIHNAGLSDCHIKILAQFQVKANLVVPLLQGTKLWGLLCIHQCNAPRAWQKLEVEFVDQIARQLGVALHQAEILANLRSEIQERQQSEQRIRELNLGLRQAILELQAVNRELESFSYSVSHDLRAPLRSIDGFSQALLEDCHEDLDATGKDYLHRIRTATQRMGNLIDDLLTLSRVTRSGLSIETINISQIAQRVCDELQRNNPHREVQMEIAAGLTAQGDAHLVEVVLENLLNNAWKFTSKHPHALIEFGAIVTPNQTTVYFVRDDGVGFDMVYVDKLFTPFQRLHGMQEFPGNGIGLATVQRIVHRHGGRVWATGAIELGATFSFTLAEEEI